MNGRIRIDDYTNEEKNDSGRKGASRSVYREWLQ